MAQPLSVLPITIGEGSAYSNVVSLAGNYVVGLISPVDWTPAALSVLVSPEGDNYYDLFDGKGNEFTFNVAPGCMLNVDPNLLMMASLIRLRSGTRKKEVPQEQERRLYLVCRQSIAVTGEMEGLDGRQL